MIPVVSIFFAFVPPLLALWKRGKGRPFQYPWLISLFSFVFCALGILAELVTIRRRLLAGDIGGIADTIDAVIMLCAALLAVTALLNLLLGFLHKRDM